MCLQWLGLPRLLRLTARKPRIRKKQSKDASATASGNIDRVLQDAVCQANKGYKKQHTRREEAEEAQLLQKLWKQRLPSCKQPTDGTTQTWCCSRMHQLEIRTRTIIWEPDHLQCRIANHKIVKLEMHYNVVAIDCNIVLIVTVVSFSFLLPVSPWTVWCGYTTNFAAKQGFEMPTLWCCVCQL